MIGKGDGNKTYMFMSYILPATWPLICTAPSWAWFRLTELDTAALRSSLVVEAEIDVMEMAVF